MNPIRFSSNKIITPGIPRIPAINAVTILIGMLIPRPPPRVFSNHSARIPSRMLIANSINLLGLSFKRNLATARTTKPINMIYK